MGSSIEKLIKQALPNAKVEIADLSLENISEPDCEFSDMDVMFGAMADRNRANEPIRNQIISTLREKFGLSAEIVSFQRWHDGTYCLKRKENLTSEEERAVVDERLRFVLKKALLYAQRQKRWIRLIGWTRGLGRFIRAALSPNWYQIILIPFVLGIFASVIGNLFTLWIQKLFPCLVLH